MGVLPGRSAVQLRHDTQGPEHHQTCERKLLAVARVQVFFDSLCNTVAIIEVPTMITRSNTGRAHTRWSLLLVSISCACAAGCGDGVDRPELGTVTGHVTMDGEPYAGVIIRYQPEEGRTSTAVIDDKGDYDLFYSDRIKGAVVGPNTVSFEWPIGKEGKGVPKKYTGKTDLQRDVESGKNTFDFELESAGEEMAPVVD